MLRLLQYKVKNIKNVKEIKLINTGLNKSFFNISPPCTRYVHIIRFAQYLLHLIRLFVAEYLLFSTKIADRYVYKNERDKI